MIRHPKLDRYKLPQRERSIVITVYRDGTFKVVEDKVKRKDKPA